jgi:hypothetical protein
MVTITYNLKVCSNFLLSYFEYRKLLLNILMDDHHVSKITKLNKKLLFPSHLGYKQNLLKETKNQTAIWWVEKDSTGSWHSWIRPHMTSGYFLMNAYA